MLGQFELKNLPPAPRGVPQIKVSFDVDANGILSISAKDKASSGTVESLTISSEKGRLSDEEIECMVQKFEEFADEDAAEKNKVMARNGLKAYLYNLKNSINDTLEGKLFDKDKEFLSKSMDDALVWCKENPAAEESEYDEKQKEVEGIANPILKKAYEISSGGGESGGDDDFMSEDVDGPSVEEMD